MNRTWKILLLTTLVAAVIATRARNKKNVARENDEAIQDEIKPTTINDLHGDTLIDQSDTPAPAKHYLTVELIIPSALILFCSIVYYFRNSVNVPHPVKEGIFPPSPSAIGNTEIRQPDTKEQQKPDAFAAIEKNTISFEGFVGNNDVKGKEEAFDHLCQQMCNEIEKKNTAENGSQNVQITNAKVEEYVEEDDFRRKSDSWLIHNTHSEIKNPIANQVLGKQEENILTAIQDLQIMKKQAKDPDQYIKISGEIRENQRLLATYMMLRLKAHDSIDRKMSNQFRIISDYLKLQELQKQNDIAQQTHDIKAQTFSNNSQKEKEEKETLWIRECNAMWLCAFWICAYLSGFLLLLNYYNRLSANSSIARHYFPDLNWDPNYPKWDLFKLAGVIYQITAMIIQNTATVLLGFALCLVILVFSIVHLHSVGYKIAGLVIIIALAQEFVQILKTHWISILKDIVCLLGVPTVYITLFYYVTFKRYITHVLVYNLAMYLSILIVFAEFYLIFCE